MTWNRDSSVLTAQQDGQGKKCTKVQTAKTEIWKEPDFQRLEAVFHICSVPMPAAV